MTPMTDKELVDEMMSDSLLSRVRRIQYSGYARIEQGQAQRNPMTTLEARRIEFDVAQRVIDLVRADMDGAA